MVSIFRMSDILSCPVLEAIHIVLNPVESSDASDLFAMWTKEGFDILGGFIRPPDLDSVRGSLEYFRSLNESGFYYKWTLRLRQTNEFLGELELYPLKPQIRPWMEWGVGYCLKSDAWSRGYMTEALQRLLKFAFEEKLILRLKADVHASNTRSIKLLKKVGFQHEGVQISKSFHDGKIHDMNLMACSRVSYLFPKTLQI